MKKLYLILLSATLLSIYCNAQTPPAIQWQKTYGGSQPDGINSIKQTFDGGYIAVGNSASNDGDVGINYGGWDWWIVKFNNAGNIQWKKTLGGSGYDQAYDVKQTADSGYITAGYSFSGSDNHGEDDAWIIKLNKNGDIEWQKSYGSSSYDGANSIQQTSDGGYVFAGWSEANDGDVTNNHGSDDFWIVKLKNNGDIQWQKSYGGSNAEDANSIEQTSDGGYIVAGVSLSNDGDVSGHHGTPDYLDYWIIKLDSNGVLQWQKSYGGTDYDEAYSVQQTFDGGYIVAGYTASNNGNVTGNHGSQDYWILKLNSSGNIQWQKTFGGSDKDDATSIAQTSDSGYVIAGYAYSNDGDVTNNHGSDDFWIIKINKGGNIQWQKSYGGTDYDGASSVQQTSDNGYIIGGSTDSDDGDVTKNQGNGDWWIVKLTPDVLLPVSLINFSGEVNGKQNLLHWTTATEQNNTGFEVQRSSDGFNFTKIGFVNSKAVNGNSNYKLNYDFADIAFNTDKNYYRLKQIDRDGIFTYSNIVVLRDNLITDAIEVYPNPVKNLLNVKVPATSNKKIKLEITDNSGKAILTKSTLISSGETIIQLNVSQLSSGAYFIKLFAADGSVKAENKFIKQ
ncbi:MAG TPA: T9SS type A sorting domain-containing protein [Parafilimonas sp.]|nr:T9SS type A sorting domain-containing protein [Parafilimonas sp.]